MLKWQVYSLMSDKIKLSTTQIMSKTKIYNKLSTQPYDHTSSYKLYDPAWSSSLLPSIDLDFQTTYSFKIIRIKLSWYHGVKWWRLWKCIAKSVSRYPQQPESSITPGQIFHRRGLNYTIWVYTQIPIIPTMLRILITKTERDSAPCPKWHGDSFCTFSPKPKKHKKEYVQYDLVHYSF
jgi:uncharacterized protein YijF (DUF1287 family)